MGNGFTNSLKRMMAFVLCLAVIATSLSINAVASEIEILESDSEERVVNEAIVDEAITQDDIVEEDIVGDGNTDNYIVDSDVIVEDDAIYCDSEISFGEDEIIDAETDDGINEAGETLEKPEILYVRQGGNVDKNKGSLKLIFKKPIGVKSFDIRLTETYKDGQEQTTKTIKEVKVDAADVPSCPKEKADNKTGYLMYSFGPLPIMDGMKNTFLYISANAINAETAPSEDKCEIEYVYSDGLYDIEFDDTVKEICDYSVEHEKFKPYNEINDDYIGDEEVANKWARVKINPKKTAEDPDGNSFIVKGVGVRYKNEKGEDKLKYATKVLKPDKKSIDYWTFKMPSSDVKIHIVKGDEEFEEPDVVDPIPGKDEEPVPKPEDDPTLGDDIIEYDTSYPDRIDLALKATDTKVSYKKSFTYTGMYIKPAVKVTVKQDGKRVTLTEGTDYIVEYKYNRDCRTLEEMPKPQIIIHGNGHYKGIYRGAYNENTQTYAGITFDINKKSIKECKALVDTGTIKEHEYVTEDRVKIYDGNKLLTQYVDYSLDMTKENFNKKGTTYVYATGQGNYKGKLKIAVSVIKPEKNTIVLRSASMNAAKLETLVYRGKAFKFKPKDFTVYSEDGTLVPVKNYTVTASRVKNYGTGYVKIKAKGKKYKGTIYLPVEIKAPDTEFEIADIKELTYSGTLKRPKPVVKAELNGKKKKLKLNKDYKITYKDNLYATPDKEYAYANIIGIGNYAGVRSKTIKFVIKPYDIKKVKAKGTKKEGITLTFNGRKLVKGVDFDYDERAGWRDELPEGIYTNIVITGYKNFRDSSYEGRFLIKPEEKKTKKKDDTKK